MKKVTVYYRMAVFCSQDIMVNDDFKFKSEELEEMIDELDREVGDFDINPLKVEGKDVNDYDFDFVYQISGPDA